MDEQPPRLASNITAPSGPRHSWTCSDLDKLQAATGPESGLTVTSHCHPRKPVTVHYYGDGLVDVECKHCSKFITSIALSHDEVERFNEVLLRKCGDPTCKDPLEDHRTKFRCEQHLKAGLFVAYHAKRLILMCCLCKGGVISLHVKEASVQA